jgi:hypothetical protein
VTTLLFLCPIRKKVWKYMFYNIAKKS